MKFLDLTTSKKSRYVLKENEKVVFFMKNRSGTFEFTLAGTGAEAHIFALFEGKGDTAYSLDITQHHKAPGTTSTALVKSLLSGDSSLSYHGLIRIEKNAEKSDAKQENRNLLLSETASAVSIPSLEVLTDDVSCSHASATGTLSLDAILYMGTRGLSQKQAEALLADGFRNSFFNEIARFGKFNEINNHNKIQSA
jgi:Fe-S cluster assembly scaffold protein SufB